MAGKLIFPGREDKTFLYSRLVPVWNCRRDEQKWAFLPTGKVTLVKKTLKPTEKDCWKEGRKICSPSLCLFHPFSLHFSEILLRSVLHRFLFVMLTHDLSCTSAILYPLGVQVFPQF